MIFLHLRLACLIKLKIKSELKLIFKQYFKRERESLSNPIFHRKMLFTDECVL